MNKFLLILHDAQDATQRGREELKERLCMLFGADMEAVELLLSELPVILERSLNKEQAEQLRAALDAAGAEIEIMEDFGPEDEKDSDSADPADSTPTPPEDTKTASPEVSSFGPELSLDEALDGDEDDEFEVLGSEAVTATGQKIENPPAIQLEDEAPAQQTPADALDHSAMTLAIDDAEEISSLASKLDKLLQAEDDEQIEEPADTLDLDSVNASIEDLKDMLDREIAADSPEEPNSGISTEAPEIQLLDTSKLSINNPEAPADDLTLAPNTDEDITKVIARPLASPPLSMNEEESNQPAVSALAITADTETTEELPIGEDNQPPDIAPDGAFARIEDLDDEEEWEYVDEDEEEEEEGEEDFDEEVAEDDLEQTQQPSWTRERYLKVGAGLSLVLLCIGLIAFYFRPAAGGRMIVDLDDPVMIKSLLSEQQRILGPEKPTDNQEAPAHPLIAWSANIPFNQTNCSLDIRTRNNMVETFDISCHSPKPKALSPEQIVLGLRAPLWLKRLEISNASSQLHTTAEHANSFEAISVAPAYIQDGEVGARVVAEIHISGDILDQPEPLISGKFRIIGGYKSTETPKYNGVDLADGSVYRLFFERDFKAELQYVEELVPEEVLPELNNTPPKGEAE